MTSKAGRRRRRIREKNTHARVCAGFIQIKRTIFSHLSPNVTSQPLGQGLAERAERTVTAAIFPVTAHPQDLLSEKHHILTINLFATVLIVYVK